MPDSLRPFFGYYGGKWRDTPRLYPEPTHDLIVEPFAGSAGYSLRYHWKKVHLVEADPILVGLWRYLIRVKPDEIRQLPDLPEGGSVDDLTGVCEEARHLIGFWLNRGVSRPKKRPSSWMRAGIRPGSFWGDRVRTTIAGQVESIRHWTVSNGGYDHVEIAGPATWFIDPPYEEQGRHYRFGSSGIDFQALAKWCRERSGQVIVCENEGASWLPFKLAGNTKTTRRGRRSREVVWLGGTEEAVDCEHCNVRLTRGETYSADGAWKACPNCSRQDGSQHVLLRFPQDFGTTPARARGDDAQEGSQSWCYECRQVGASGRGVRKRCNDVRPDAAGGKGAGMLLQELKAIRKGLANVDRSITGRGGLLRLEVLRPLAERRPTSRDDLVDVIGEWPDAHEQFVDRLLAVFADEG